MIGSFLKQVSWWFIDLNLGSLMTYADPLKCIHKKTHSKGNHGHINQATLLTI